MRKTNPKASVRGLTTKDLKEILDAVPASLFVKDAQSRILLMNRECEEQWGVKFTDVEGTDASQFYSPEQMQEFIDGDKRAFADGIPIDVEEVLWNAKFQGNRCVHTTKKPVYDKTGKPRFLICISLDEQKITEIRSQIESNETNLSKLFERSTLGIGLNDMSGRFVKFNRALKNICGYSDEEMKALAYWDLTPQEYLPQEALHMDQLTKSGLYGPYEKEYIRKDGSRIPLRLNGVLVTGSDGKEYIWSVVEDISDSKRTKLQLEESLQRFSRLVNSIPQMVWTAQTSGELTFINDQWQKFLGEAAASPLAAQQSMFRSLSPASRKAVNEVWNQSGLIPKNEFNLEMQALRQDGEYRWLELHAVPIMDQNETISRWIGTMTDISERRMAEQHLFESQKLEALGSLTGGLAHDFNNLLGVVLGNLDLLSASPLNAKSAAQVRVALAAAERGAELTKSLLAVARGQTTKRESTNLKELLLNLEPLLTHTAGVRVCFRIKIELDDAVVLVDRAALESSLLNLVINARDAMPQGGDLILTLRTPSKLEAMDLPHGNSVTLELEDTGLGMTPEVLRKATNPFFSTKERGRGTGLGLAMVNAFAHESEGSLHIHSEVGVGTTVQLTLPVTNAIAPVKAPPQSQLAAAEKSHGMTHVLVVEDEAPLRVLLSNWLYESGYVVQTCATGDEAWASLQKKMPDILITDVIMPGKIDGLELARQVRNLSPTLPILLVSGYPIDVEKALTDLNLPMLPKPYRREQVLIKIAELLGV
jgi:PAS domain S-box-containing protein